MYPGPYQTSMMKLFANIVRDLRLLTAKTNPQVKLKVLLKSINMYIWAIGILNQLFIRGSYTQIKFQKNEVVSGESPFFVIGPFCTSHSILTLAFDWAVLYGNVACSFVVHWTKKLYSSFLRKVLVFQKTFLKLRYCKFSFANFLRNRCS